MFRLLATALLALAMACADPALATTDAEVLERAGAEDYDAAIALLSHRDAQTRASYDHRFLRARILSWAGRHEEADAALSRLRADYPGNADLEVASGNLAYYKGDFDTAESWYASVAASHPDYADARTGLANVAIARASTTRWRLDSGVTLSNLDQEGLPSWDDRYARVEYRTDALAYHVGVESYDRFGRSDIQVGVGVSDGVRGGWDWGLTAAATPNADFRPDYSIGGHVGQTVQAGRVTLQPNISYRYDDYATGGIHTVQPGVTGYFRDGTQIGARAIATLQDAQADQVGWLVEGRRPVAKSVDVRLGFANAPEAIDRNVVTTQTLFGGLTYEASEVLDLHLDFARSEREKSYTRDSISVGLTFRR